MSSKITLFSLSILIGMASFSNSGRAQGSPKCADADYKCSIDGCACPPHIKIPKTPPAKTGAGSKGPCQTGNKAADSKCNQGRDVRKGGSAGSL